MKLQEALAIADQAKPTHRQSLDKRQVGMPSRQLTTLEKNWWNGLIENASGLKNGSIRSPLMSNTSKTSHRTRPLGECIHEHAAASHQRGGYGH